MRFRWRALKELERDKELLRIKVIDQSIQSELLLYYLKKAFIKNLKKK